MRRIVILLGPPGVGKGTVSKLLVNHFQFEWLSSGDLLRDVSRSGADLGRQISQLIDAGRFVPDELIISLVEEKLSDYPNNCNLLLDGFPRTIRQAVSLDAMLKGLVGEISLVLELQADNEELERRILARAEEEGRKGGKTNHAPKHRRNAPHVCESLALKSGEDRRFPGLAPDHRDSRQVLDLE